MSRRGSLVWFRRDLRDVDHAALAQALRGGGPVYAAFVFDREILDALPTREDARVAFIHASVVELDAALRARGGALIAVHDFARAAIPRLAETLNVAAVHASRDHEPAAVARDAAVAGALSGRGIAWHACKDTVVFERDDVLAQSGRPFTVYTPYRNAWLRRLAPAHLAAHDCAGPLARPPAALDRGIPPLDAIGFASVDLAARGAVAGMRGARERLATFLGRIDRYGEARDFPAADAASGLSVHLRFGTIPVRTLVREAHERALRPGGAGAAKWRDELVWREFFAQLLWHFPHVAEGAFRRELDGVRHPGSDALYEAWRDGRTGYPIVDAGMRQLAATGVLPNRVRMIAASFLVKDLLVDWRRGERLFAQRLLDYDLASNNGNWQWVAGTGSDAQPWFRIFNPVTQSRRFDPGGAYIRRHVPELAAVRGDEIHAPWLLPPAEQRDRRVVVGRDYPPPIVDHAVQRERALALYRRT